MERDDIIRMAREAGFPIFGTKVVANNSLDQIMADAVTEHYHETAIQFAALIAAAEREACAIAAEAVVPRHTECGNKIAAAIRARGKE